MSIKGVKRLEFIRGAEALKLALELLNQTCREPGDPLAPEGPTQWPSRIELDAIATAARRTRFRIWPGQQVDMVLHPGCPK